MKYLNHLNDSYELWKKNTKMEKDAKNKASIHKRTTT